jgi:hypothetical protein
MQRRSQLALTLASTALGLILGLAATATAAEKKQPAAAVPAAGKLHPLLGIALPESHFDNDPNVGKDPFFPDSNRRLPKSPVLTKAVVTEVNRANLLTLRGISGPSTRRIALINNLTFVAGEEGTVRTGSGLLKIRVVSVEDKMVSVLIDGDSQPRELILNDKTPDSIQIQTSQVDK